MEIRGFHYPQTSSDNVIESMTREEILIANLCESYAGPFSVHGSVRRLCFGDLQDRLLVSGRVSQRTRTHSLI